MVKSSAAKSGRSRVLLAVYQDENVTEKWCGVPPGRIFRRQSPRLVDLVSSRLSQDCGTSEALITGIPDAMRRQKRVPDLPPHSAGRTVVHLCICAFVHLYIYAFLGISILLPEAPLSFPGINPASARACRW
jgi:hypothetical protein